MVDGEVLGVEGDERGSKTYVSDDRGRWWELSRSTEEE
jgi:hypothetical protein